MPAHDAQVFVFACAHAAQVKHYIEASKWASQRGVEVKVAPVQWHARVN